MDASPPRNFQQDPYTPPKIAALVELAGIRKVELGALQTLTLGVLAGAFIAFGGMLFTVAVTESTLGLGPTRLLGGAAFSLGLILVLVGGAELFTGNNLIVMAWADHRVGTAKVLRNWGLVYVGNLVGAVATALIMHWSGALSLGDGAVRATAIAIAQGKAALGFDEAFFRGVLANALVCLAVWLSYAARRVSGKILAIVPPITAFVALGFEHSIANMYLIPVAMLQAGSGVAVGDFLWNLMPVTLGNIVGGSGFVGLVYWLVYLRKGK